MYPQTVTFAGNDTLAINMNPTAKDIIERSVKQAARLFHEGNLHDCQLLIGHTLQADPFNDEALQIAGLLKLRVGESADAVSLLEMARETAPSNPDHHNNLALAYSKVGRYAEAVACLREALAMAPGRQVFWVNLGVQLRHLANTKTPDAREVMMKEAEEAVLKAIEIKPDYAQAHASLGSLYAEQKMLPQAAVCYEKALSIDPAMSGVHVDLSYMYFLQGDFDKAWPHYEYRMQHYPQASRWEKVFPTSKRWDGKTPLDDKTVIVFCEQGCGDAIHFARYIPLVKAGKLLICCHDPLRGLMSQFGETYSMGAKTPAYDVSIPIMSLPLLLGKQQPAVPYITMPQPAAGMESYAKTFNVGLCWAGNPQHPGDRFRSIPLREFVPLGMEGVTLFSLQKDYRPRKYHDSDEIVDLCKDGPKIVDLSPLLTTFNDTANFVAAMDLVISVDTAVMHLAGALGRETWALIPYNPDWRWGLEGSSTPLYPSVELFRQSEKNDWRSVMGRIGARLRDKAKPATI